MRRIQLFFLLGVLAITLHFSILFGQELVRYLLLKEKAIARIAQWEIIPIKKCFAFKAEYSFEDKGKTYQGTFVFPPPYYLNEWAALSELKIKAKEPWSAFYRENDPQKSALQKSFPFGLGFRWACCVGVLGYCFVIKRRVFNYN